MNAIRSQSLLGEQPPPVWTRMEDFRRVIGRRFRFFLWENALRQILQSARHLDRRGIVLGSEASLHANRNYVLDLIRDVLGLSGTPGWRRKPPDYAEAIMASFYRCSGPCVAWVMVETCREKIQDRHARLQDRLFRGERPAFLTPASALESRRLVIPMDADLRLPTRSLRFSLPDDRGTEGARLARTMIRRTLWTPTRPVAFSATITNWCLAHAGLDDTDLAKGFVPSGLQCQRQDGINGASLIMWYRLSLKMKLGRLDSYAVDIDPLTGHLLSLRQQHADLLTAVEIDPWLNDWLIYALRHF